MPKCSHDFSQKCRQLFLVFGLCDRLAVGQDLPSLHIDIDLNDEIFQLISFDVISVLKTLFTRHSSTQWT